MQVPGSSHLREEEKEAVHILLLNQSQFMESEINSNPYLVLEWLCESTGWIPISSTLQSAASGILRVTSFLRMMLQLKHISCLCRITGRVAGTVCSHEGGGTRTSVLAETDFLIVNIKKKAAMSAREGSAWCCGAPLASRGAGRVSPCLGCHHA